MTELSADPHGNPDVVTLLVTMAVKPEYEQEFLDFAAHLTEKVHAEEPGTLLYVLTRHPTKSHTYLWVERYRNQDALQAHSETAHVGEAMARVQDPKWWANPPEMMQLSQVIPR